MASEPVRLALVGAGRMGAIHLGAMQSSEEIDLVAVVEPFAASRDALADRGLALYESVDQLLATETPEGALIAAPSDQHSAVVARFATAGVPMLCEKPLGVRVEDAVDAAQIAKEAGVLLQIGYFRRFVPELRELRRRIQDAEFGEIYQVACMQWDHEPPSEQFRARSGGISVDMGVHEFDQTRWLLGQEFEWVAAAGAAAGVQERKPADPDAAVILGRLSAGAAVTISLGRRFPHEDSCWIEVWGTDGYARISFLWDVEGVAVYQQAMRRQAEAFARAVRGCECEGAQATDAVAALGLAELCARSLTADGARITTPHPVAA